MTTSLGHTGSKRQEAGRNAIGSSRTERLAPARDLEANRRPDRVANSPGGDESSNPSSRYVSSQKIMLPKRDRSLFRYNSHTSDFVSHQ